MPDLPAGTAQCPGGVIDYVFIDNASIFDPRETDADSRFTWAYRLANRLHRRTRDEVIRRELLFAEG